MLRGSSEGPLGLTVSPSPTSRVMALVLNPVSPVGIELDSHT